MLPQHYTDLLIRSLRDKSTALRDFLDLFNHRSGVAVPSRLGKVPPAGDLRAPRAGRGSGDVVRDGPGRPGHAAPARRSLAVDDEAIAHYAGHYSHWPRSVAALEAVLSDFFARPVQIEQFRGRWVWLAPDDVTVLPSRSAPDGAFGQLGVNAVVGDRVWDVQGSFRIRIGPVGYAQFASFMPGSRDLAQLVDLTRLFVGPTLQLRCAADPGPARGAVPAACRRWRLCAASRLEHLVEACRVPTRRVGCGLSAGRHVTAAADATAKIRGCDERLGRGLRHGPAICSGVLQGPVAGDPAARLPAERASRPRPKAEASPIATSAAARG
mgnify:CR=1 FL=1